MAPHSSTLAWKIPWIEEPGGLPSMGLHRVGHDWATSLSISCTGEGNGNPLQWSCLENPRDRGAWWAAVYGVAQSWTWLTWLSSSRSCEKSNSRERVLTDHYVPEIILDIFLSIHVLYILRRFVLNSFLKHERHKKFNGASWNVKL